MYTDQESGISVSSNGSKAADSFMNTFQKVINDSEALKQVQKDIISKKYGFAYFVDPDGWVTKCKQKGFNSFEGVLAQYPLNAPEVGQLICVGMLGWEFKFVLYRITEVRRSLFGEPSIVYGEEIEEFSTKELV